MHMRVCVGCGGHMRALARRFNAWNVAAQGGARRNYHEMVK